jgi:hypothetical protein
MTVRLLRTFTALACLLCCAAIVPALAGAAEPTAIEGVVTEVGTGNPIAGTLVIARGPTETEAITNASGNYKIEGLVEGAYEVDFTGLTCVGSECVTPKYAERYYDGVLPQNQGTPVPVQEEQTTAGVNAALELNGSIVGHVADSQGTGIFKTFVCTNSQTEYFHECSITNGAGDYVLPNLPPGEFNVQFTGILCTALLCEWEACELGASCPHPYIAHYWENGLTDEEATLVTVTSNQAHEGIDATLPSAGQIKGKVTIDALGAPPLAGFVVCGSGQTTPAVGECTTTNAAGEYTLEGLGSSDWQVEFKEACPNGEPCPGAYETQVFHELVALAAPEVKTGVDASIKELTPQVPAFTSDPVATGVPVVSRTLSCSEGTWTHNPTAIAFTWLRNGAPIPGAESPTYKTVAADQDNDVTCEVTISNTAGSKEALSNNVLIGPEVAPAFTTQPGLSGTAAVGSTLSCAEGAAANYPLSTAFAWLRDGTVIPGQAGTTYNVAAEDAGAMVSCRVTMTNGAGSASASSNGLAIPAKEEGTPNSGAGSGSGSNGTSTQPGTVTVTVPAPVPPSGTASAGAKAKAGRSVSVTLTCSGQAACQGSLKLTVKKKGKTITIGTASFNIAVGKSQSVAVKLTAKGEKLLGEAGKAGLKVKLTGTAVKPRTLQIH